MAEVLYLEKFIYKKQAQKSYSIIDMIMDKSYRRKTYEYYDSIHEPSDEGEKIFKEWTKRRTGKDN